MTRIQRQLLKAVPAAPEVLAWGARLPPVLKGVGLTRCLGALRSTIDPPPTLVSNLGIKTSFRVSLPPGTSSSIVFGRPGHYVAERGALHLASALSAKCSAFIDIGSNLGYFVFFLRGTGVRVPIYFFEPHPELYRVTSENIARNGLMKVTGYQTAVGDFCGSATFHLNLEDLSSSSLDPYFSTHHPVREIPVTVTTLDAFVRSNRLTNVFVKVDVEAAEHQFWAGADPIADHISYLLIEVLCEATNRGFVRMLIARGFHAYYINDFALEHSPDGSFGYVAPQFNWLFCRATPDELRRELSGTNFTVKG